MGRKTNVNVMSRNNPPDILAAQAKLLEVAQRQTNEEIQKKLEMLGKQVAAAPAQTNSRKQQVQNQPKSTKPNNSPYRRPAAKVDAREPRIIEKFEDLVGVIDELGKDVRPTYAGSKSAQERLKRGLQHARQLVRECQNEGEKIVRQGL